MRLTFLAAVAAVALTAQAASAQVTAEFRGIRAEGNVGWDRFKSVGQRNDKLGYGATVGFDGTINQKFVIGPEATFWRANNWSENSVLRDGGTLSSKSFEEYGAAVRAGYLFLPDLLVFGKGGYVSNEQRTRFNAPVGGVSYYNHQRTDGYQVGGGVEYTLSQFNLPVPVYVDAQYVYAKYDDNTSRQRAMFGIGVRFK